jgi:tetratricopeptide (TPR) repeat protein
MACLGLVTGLALRDAPPVRSPLVGVALAVGVGAAALSLALPALAAREVERAARIWARDPAAGLRAIESARRLNPLSARPDIVGGALARAAGDPDTARLELARALARDPRDWHAEAELGVLALAAGQRAAALERLGRARQLAPRVPALAAALDAARRNAPVPAGVEAELERLAARRRGAETVRSRSPRRWRPCRSASRSGSRSIASRWRRRC